MELIADVQPEMEILVHERIVDLTGTRPGRQLVGGTAKFRKQIFRDGAAWAGEFWHPR
jgi:hypothetical protein